MGSRDKTVSLWCTSLSHCVPFAHVPAHVSDVPSGTIIPATTASTALTPTHSATSGIAGKPCNPMCGSDCEQRV